MDPVKWINGNNTAYFKLKLAEYNAVMDLKVQNGGVRDDLPSYLARVWLVPDISPDILSCDLEGDACRIPTFDQVLPGSGRWEQEARYAILQQIGNWHAIFQNLLAQSEEGEQTVGLELPSMVKQLSWTDEMDAWRNQDYRTKQTEAHIALTVVLTVTGILGAAVGPVIGGVAAGTAFAASAATYGATAAGAIAGMSGAWAGATSLWMDGAPNDEHRNEQLIMDAQYWVGHQGQMIRRGTDFNYRHLMNGGSLGNEYNLADFFQWGGFLVEHDPLKLGEMIQQQQYSLAADRILKEDRVYILRYTNRGACSSQQLMSSKGEAVGDSKLVCLPELPNDSFFVYSAPKDYHALNGELPHDHSKWYRGEDRRVRGVAGIELLESGWKGFNLQDVVRSSIDNWDKGSQVYDNLLDEALRYRNGTSFARFTVPVCKNPSQKARASHYGTRMPAGMPCECEGGEGIRFLQAQGLPDDSDRNQPLACGYRDLMEGLLECDQHTENSKTVETCAASGYGGINVPSEPPNPCEGVTIPKDPVYDIPTVVLDYNGCPKIGTDGQMIELRLEDYRSRGWVPPAPKRLARRAMDFIKSIIW